MTNKFRTIIVLLVAPFLQNTLFGQNQGSKWYFSEGNALDFSTAPPSLIGGSAMTSFAMNAPIEGSSTISDANGNLLFYCSGTRVWNKDHQLMPNGAGLAGGESSTQAALIVPKPGSDRLFYIFTTDHYQNQLVNGLCYSEVDMCLDNGKGDIIPGRKNIFVVGPVAEKLTATNHFNDSTYWIVTHKFNTNEFYSYHLTSAGLSAPVISACGSIHPNTVGNVAAAIGQLKISPDGRWLANVFENSTVGLAELFSFDNSTGIVSNAISLPVTNREYGVAFSQGSTKLYLSNAGKHKVFQFDLSSNDPNQIVNSYTTIIDRPVQPVLGMQLGPDGKIYICTGVSSIDVISNPELLGTACNYIVDALILPVPCYWSLPGMIDTYRYTNGEIDCEVIDGNDSLPLIEMPNVFTPNGDSKNDLFLPTTYRKILSSEITIYNRWGILVFESSNANSGWNGKNKKQALCTPGTYYYILNYSDSPGNKKTIKGWIELIR